MSRAGPVKILIIMMVIFFIAETENVGCIYRILEIEYVGEDPPAVNLSALGLKDPHGL